MSRMSRKPSSRDRTFPRFGATSADEALAFECLCSESGPREGIPVLPKLGWIDFGRSPPVDPLVTIAHAPNEEPPRRLDVRRLRRLAIAALFLVALGWAWAGVTVVMAR